MKIHYIYLWPFYTYRSRLVSLDMYFITTKSRKLIEGRVKCAQGFGGEILRQKYLARPKLRWG